MMHKGGSNEAPRLIARLAGAAVLLVIFLLLTWNAGRSGFASLLSAYAARTGQIAPANAAVRLSPNDPDAHFTRASVLEAGSDLPAAIAEYNEAASARPDDYVLWLSLARARELNGETAGAIAAARRAVPLAPYYAQPHWQLGNILLRAGQTDEAFKELSLAGTSNSTLMPGIIDLAWRLKGGDPQFVKRAIQPQTPEAYQALAAYFRNRGEIAEAIAMFRAAGSAAESERRAYLTELIAAKRFKDAYALWSVAHPANLSNMVGTLTDPSFEQESDLEEPGFGWRTTGKVRALNLSLDTSQPKEGRSSLRVVFNGDSEPGAPVISQLVLVEPHTHYQLHFAFRCEGIVSGGPPQVLVIDVNDSHVLGQSIEFPRDTRNWEDVNVDFTSGQSTVAVQINLQREGCAKSPCPIFGRLWLDNFSLAKL